MTAQPKTPPIKVEMPEDLKEHDKVTQTIWKILSALPIGDKPLLANMYYSSPMLYNYMLVGATGTLLSWFLYELIFRPQFLFLGGLGTFGAMVFTTLCVFIWNFIWNKRWSLSPKSQLLKMNAEELREHRDLVLWRIAKSEEKTNN